MCKQEDNIVNVEKGEVPLLSKSSETYEPQHGKIRTKSTIQALLTFIASVLTIHSIYVLKTRHAQDNTILDVWASGWATAACSAFGVLPFLWFGKNRDNSVATDTAKEEDCKLAALCNAIAAGVMISASLGLVMEGLTEESTPGFEFLPFVCVVGGCYLGIGFIILTGNYFGEPSAVDLAGAVNIKRVVVIMAAMTLHAFSEGVGIGVAHRSQSTGLGSVVSASLAIHNIPEGLAVSAALIPRGYSKITTMLLCIFSSLPQPLMAVLSFFFVPGSSFITLGYGFASGAMSYVAVFELLPESREVLSTATCYIVLVLSMFCMGLLQLFVRDNLADC